MSFLDVERGTKIDHRIDTGAIVDGAVTPPKLDRAYPQVVGGTISGGTIDGSYAYNFSSSSGTFAGIATQHLLKAGDTATGLIEFANGLQVDSGEEASVMKSRGVFGTATTLIAKPGSSDKILAFEIFPSGNATSVNFKLANSSSLTDFGWVRWKIDGTSVIVDKGTVGTGAAPTSFTFDLGFPVTFNDGLTSAVGPNNLSGTAGVGLKIPTAAPASPEAGSMYFDTTSTLLYIYDGTAWRSVALT